MKIAIFVDAFPVWTETFIINQMTGLIDRGHELEIYSSGRRKLDSAHSVIDEYKLIDRTHYLSDIPENRFKRLRFLIKLLLKESRWVNPKTWPIFFKIIKYRRKALPWSTLSLLSIALPNIGKKPHDILHCQFGTLGPRVLFLKQIGALNGKLVTSFRGHDATQQHYANSGFYNELFNKGDLFFPVSEYLEKCLVSMGCNKSKIRILHSGIKCNKFKFKERVLVENEIVKIVSIARFVEMKGLEYAIKAIALLIKNNRNISYSIIGDGKLRNEIETLISDLHLDKHVHLLGWKNHEEITKILENSHILLAPSVTAKNGETEGIPNAVKEAMAIGLPVLSTLHSGIPELVKNGISGFLVPERDAEALADRLIYLIEHPEAWPKMGHAGREFVEAEFDIEKLNELLIEYYNSP